MPFTVKDVAKHITGLQPKQQRAWVHIANSILESVRGPERTREASAIKQANAGAKRIRESRLADLDDRQIADLVEAILRHMDSDNGIRDTLQAALCSSYLPEQADPENYWGPRPWIRDIFDNGTNAGTVVYDWGGDIWQADFTISRDATGEPTATVGDPLEVDVAYIPLDEAETDDDLDEAVPDDGRRHPVAISREFTELSETAIGNDGTALIKLIRPGWGDKGYYSRDMLAESGPGTFRAGLKMFWNHPTKQEEALRPERDLRDLAAELTEDARFMDDGPKGAGLYAKAKVFGHYRESLEDLAPHIGVSIRATGWTHYGQAEGREGNIVESFIRAKSADFVTYPGAGGEILNLFESARGHVDDLAENTAKEGSDHDMALTKEERQAIIEEARQGMATELQEARQTIARLQEAQVVSNARDIWAALITRQPDLMPQTKARLIEAMPVARIPAGEDGQLDRAKWIEVAEAAIKDERKYVTSLSGNRGTVLGMGSGTELAESLHDDDGGPVLKPEEVETRLTGAFRVLGLSESAAKVAAAGHAR